jgi:tRNA dimethylallyltransferase
MNTHGVSTADCWFLTGPTASGKSAVGLELAGLLGAEIISLDSMAVYRGMDIGTAKPTPAQRQRVPHHLISVLDPWDSASVAWWLREAQRCALDIEKRGRKALFVGGTPLYLKALLCGLFDGPPQDAEMRRQLMLEARSTGSASLHLRLAQHDAVTAARLHPNDLRRVVRALEVLALTGRPISAWQTQWRQPQLVDTDHPSCLWLDLPRSSLYARINARVHQMFADGIVEEAQLLRSLDRPVSKEAAQALGYKEAGAYLDGQLTLEECIDRVQTRSRQFAKRQMTWFRHLPGCRPATRELTFSLWGLTMDG